jgi:hypothetical protein
MGYERLAHAEKEKTSNVNKIICRSDRNKMAFIQVSKSLRDEIFIDYKWYQCYELRRSEILGSKSEIYNMFRAYGAQECS